MKTLRIVKLSGDTYVTHCAIAEFASWSILLIFIVQSEFWSYISFNEARNPFANSLLSQKNFTDVRQVYTLYHPKHLFFYYRSFSPLLQNNPKPSKLYSKFWVEFSRVLGKFQTFSLTIKWTSLSGTQNLIGLNFVILKQLLCYCSSPVQLISYCTWLKPLWSWRAVVHEHQRINFKFRSWKIVLTAFVDTTVKNLLDGLKI